MIRRLAAAVLRRAIGPVTVAAPPPPEAEPDPVNATVRVQELIAAHPVLLFMKGDPDRPQCGFSGRTVGALASLGVDFAHVDVLAEPDLREAVKVHSQWPTIPQLYVNGDFVGGCDIVEEMLADGSLADLLGVQPAPPVQQTSPAEVAAWIAQGQDVLLLDVRTPEEVLIASVVHASLLTNDRFAELEGLPRDTRIAFLCHHGIRSQAAAEAFRSLGFTQLHNVVGGIDAWSAQVDPKVPRY